MVEASATFSDGTQQREAAFFGTLLCLAVLDLFLLLLILNPFTRVSGIEHSSQAAPAMEQHSKMDNTVKPSPFRAAERARTVHGRPQARLVRTTKE